jgi:hypothetical protein
MYGVPAFFNIVCRKEGGLGTYKLSSEEFFGGIKVIVVLSRKEL